MPFLDLITEHGILTKQRYPNFRLIVLALSDSFRRLNLEPNSNYRFIRLCIQRLLGREPFDDREIYAWSTVLATQGLEAFVDGLLNSDEYQTAFGDDSVPYQRRRLLPQRAQGDRPLSAFLVMTQPSAKSWSGWGISATERNLRW